MRLALLNILILISASLMGQSFIGLNKTGCHTQANKTVNENGFTSFYKESEFSLIFEISRYSNPYTTLTLYFNKEGICNLQTQTYSCETCMYYAYQKVLRNKKTPGKKIKTELFIHQFQKG